MGSRMMRWAAARRKARMSVAPEDLRHPTPKSERSGLTSRRAAGTHAPHRRCRSFGVCTHLSWVSHGKAIPGGYSSAGRASRWQREGQGFDPPCLHNIGDDQDSGCPRATRCFALVLVLVLALVLAIPDRQDRCRLCADTCEESHAVASAAAGDSAQLPSHLARAARGPLDPREWTNAPRSLAQVTICPRGW